MPKIDVESVRKDFPILSRTIHDKPLVYLDNGATAQKPHAVIDAIAHFYRTDYSSAHRGVHTLAEKTTQAYEDAREKVRAFVNAKSVNEIVFVRGTTEAINLVADTFVPTTMKAGDEVIVTVMEHHSNLVPWHMAAKKHGIIVRAVRLNEAGDLDLHHFDTLLNKKTKLVALTHVSNVLGTINPVKEIIARAHSFGVPVLIDGAQAAPHMALDMQALDCDFYAFSGHKLYGPTGIGVLYAKEHFLNSMPPYQGGGSMITDVTMLDSHYLPAPHRYEAGTPNIAGAIGLGAAIDYLSDIGLDAIHQHEHMLLHAATESLSTLPGLKIIGQAAQKASVISFVMEDIHPHDVATILDSEGVATRAGHHCCMPLMDYLGLPATVRVTFGIYNNVSEVDALLRALHKVKEVFA